MSINNPIHVLNKRVILYQAQDGFRTSLDSVMLAAACPAQEGDSILDLGCGVGSAGICVLERVKNTSLTGVDIQDDHIDIAKKNAEINNITNRIVFTCADIRASNEFGPHNHVICNPPYKDAGGYVHSPSVSKAKAMGHYDDAQNLQDWITCAWNHIKGQGSLTLIHEAGRTDTILHALYSSKGGRRFGNVEIIPLFPKSEMPAKRVIVRAYKHKKSPASILPGLIVHKDNGDYSEAAEQVLRNAHKLY